MKDEIAIITFKTFIKERLDGNTDSIVDYDLGRLRSDKLYGCPGRKFDPDDTNLMRAIYCVVFGDVWENLSWENSGEGKLRGDTINSSATFFSYPWKDEFTSKWNPPAELSEKIKTFQHTFHTIGNMMVLPDKRIDGWSINQYRGCHAEWHDYEDRFLAALYEVLTGKPDYEEDLQDFVQLNEVDFAPFYGEEGWRRFIDGNILNDYVDADYQPIIKSKGYTWWRSGYVNKQRFFAEANRYIDDSTRIIHNRGKRMLDILKERLCQ